MQFGRHGDRDGIHSIEDLTALGERGRTRRSSDFRCAIRQHVHDARERHAVE